MTDTIDALFRLTDTAAARATDPVTSHEAAEDATKNVWPSHVWALEIMRAHGKPMTAEQIVKIAAARELPVSASRMRSAPRELFRKGLVDHVGYTSPARGRRRQLWEAVDAR